MNDYTPIDFVPGEKVAYLSRISKIGKDDNDRDREETERLASQDNAVLNYLKTKQIIIDPKYHYKEIGSAYSRPISKREEIQKILIAAKKKEITALAFFKLDRLSRADPIMAVLFIRELNEAGCKIFSYTEGWVGSIPIDPWKEAILIMQLTGALMQSQDTSIRVKAKFASKLALAKGDKTKAKLGGIPLTKIPDNIKSKIIELTDQGFSVQYILNELHCPERWIKRVRRQRNAELDAIRVQALK